MKVPSICCTKGCTTTRFHSFTDGTISSVCDSEFVGNFFTDNIPDGNRPLAFLSSVIPNFVSTSVGKKKQLPMVLQTKIACKKKSCLKYTDGLVKMSTDYSPQ